MSCCWCSGSFRIFADGGFTFAVIHRQTLTAAELSSVYWLTVVVGVALYAGTAVVGAPLLSLIYDEPRLRALIALGALSFVIVPFSLLHLTLLRKELQFNLVAKVEALAALAGLTAMIAGGLAGLGLMSLVAGLFGNNLARTVLFVVLGSRTWRPSFRLRFREARFFVRFGSFQIGERLTNYLAARSDQILISVFLGVDVLGYYTLAWNLIVDPVFRINPIITRVSDAIFARVQDEPARLKRGFLTLIEIVAMINLPLIAGIAALAPLLVPWMFGEQWIPVVPIMQILAFVGAVKAVTNPTGSLVLAMGRADLAFRWASLSALCQAPVLLLVVQFGSILVVATTVALFQLFVLSGIYWLLYRPLLGPCLGEWLGKILVPLGFALTMAAAILLGSHLLGMTGSIGIAIGVLLGITIYLGLYALLRREALASLTRLALIR